jgi:hypothetical protein
MRVTLLCPAVAVVAWLGAAGAGTDFQATLNAAMGPYYAALVASSRGNVEATQRQILLFASAWDAVVRQGRAGAPPALAADPGWDDVLARGLAAIRSARERVRRRDVTGAHSDLESIRLALRDIRGRHGLLIFDDHLTDYHDAMERAVGHVGGRNEIRLRPGDFDDIHEDVQTAREAWRAAEATAGGRATSPGWAAAVQHLRTSLDAADRAALGRDPDATTRAVEVLHDRYYDLLGVLARSR